MLDLCDFHSHILPNADHGSSSVTETLAQLELAMKYGVKRIFATPHFYPHEDSVERFITRRHSAYSRLSERMLDNGQEIVLGSEVLLCPGLERLPGIEKLCISGTNTMLLELPFNDFGNDYIRTVEILMKMGFNIVLAHAECYNVEHIEDILSLGALIQCNASAFMSFFKNRVIEGWKARKKLVALGSDIHRADKRAYKMFDVARRKLGPYCEYIKDYSDSIWRVSIKGNY